MAEKKKKLRKIKLQKEKFSDSERLQRFKRRAVWERERNARMLRVRELQVGENAYKYVGETPTSDEAEKLAALLGKLATGEIQLLD